MNRVEIDYCPRCRWLLRAAWYAQELLSSFETELEEVALRPADSGVFAIRLNGEVLADRARDQGFPEITALKRAVRDRVAPDRSLGHADRADPNP
ncbi:MAG: SelT/SelW/SelH family protein [Panacagrimonas sp.]|jgi:selenoprotein W-related protein|nr:SelT/SelW/SelH family protein [Panacagrimonas sp.]MCC2656201.1 SelT/SelW/SelH family protein [Panacagrimonas sp.]